MGETDPTRDVPADPLPEPPYYAVIFRSQQSEETAGYRETARRMEELAAEMPGFPGVESVRDAIGRSITVSYWKDTAAIARWKAHGEHREAQAKGKELWYRNYRVEIAKVERAYAAPLAP